MDGRNWEATANAIQPAIDRMGTAELERLLNTVENDIMKGTETKRDYLLMAFLRRELETR